MRIYTGAGDDGCTDRPDGQRLAKSDARVAASGEIDELNAHLGSCLATCGKAEDQTVRDVLSRVQQELCALGAEVAGAAKAGSTTRPDDALVRRLEREIDQIWRALPVLEHFLLPGGCQLASRLHIARTVCRRAERAVVAARQAGATISPEGLKYLNRLGDLLFALARKANHDAGRRERTWKG